MNFTFSLFKNDIAKTGVLLGAFGAILVLILAFVHFFATDAIAEAKAGVEKRARDKVYKAMDFTPKAVYLLEASQSQAKDTFINLFNEMEKHPEEKKNPFNLKQLDSKRFIEFLVFHKNEKRAPAIQNMPILTKKQYKALVKKLKKHKIKIISYYTAFKKSNKSNLKLKGWVVKNSASGGYGGNINMLIGFTKEKKITGYLMVDHNETPGLGVKANEEKFISGLSNAFNKVGFTNKFNKLDTKKDFKDYLGFDSISGATITSVAVANGIAEAYNKLKVKIDAPDQTNPFELPKKPKGKKVEKVKKIELVKKRKVAKKRHQPRVNKRSGELQLRPPKHESDKSYRTKEENDSALEKLLKEQ